VTFGAYGRSASSSGIGLYGLGEIGVRGEVNSPTGWAAKFTTSQGNGVYVSVPAGQVGLNVASGTKNAVVRTADGARLLYVEESTEVWFTDYGFAQLEDGVANVTFDPIFAQTVDPDGYQVYVQAYGDAQVYVSERTPEGFSVRLSEGEPNVRLSYRLVARRMGYAGHRLERAPWADGDPNLYPEHDTNWAAIEGIEFYLEPEEMEPLQDEDVLD
jgi:hypothetical protein